MASINGTLGNDNLTWTLESDFIFGDLGDVGGSPTGFLGYADFIP
ncbi:MAG TPA: hypothetical protein VE944_31515 [Nostoc sp.]|nr:hypothetical protein [Nostoc sp.]HYX18820.1 hypothetical protein [Nostoc sp.]